MPTPAQLIGHRGAARLAPENTLPGIELAARLGLPWIEIDAQLTRDGVLVLMHDHELERTTDLTGTVREHDWATLAQADAGAWFGPEYAGVRIPRLDATIELCRSLGIGMHIEIKPLDTHETDTAEAVADLLRTVALPESLIISSFSGNTVATMHRLLPDHPRAQGAEHFPEDWREISRSLELDAWHVDANIVTPELAPMLREAGLAVRAWTVNDRDRARQLIDWGVESVFTDDPPTLLGR
ncbi:MAG: glycerophosphodiester phosphodiesterase family protein [Acidihalobacter sp.]|uniref:glycerophosphodiester phosphodiesterase family protein n=1 Tax=Acidihalobacter sp. TaxID=1872108 RepID=UPI00307FAB38